VKAEPVAVKAEALPAKAKSRPVAETPSAAVVDAKTEAPVVADAKVSAKKVVTRASIIGEEQQRLRAEEERRNAELRARQEAEFKSKQQRSADLASPEAGCRRTRRSRPRPPGLPSRLPHRPRASGLRKTRRCTSRPAKPATADKKVADKKAPEKKVADKKGQWKNEGANKRPGLKTRGATGARAGGTTSTASELPGWGWRRGRAAFLPVAG
jgi:hypothetical protein